MDPKRWTLIQDKFDAALALSSFERDAFVARIEDSFVRDEVSSLLRAHVTGREFLERRFEPAQPPESRGTLQVGMCLGAWRIVRFIGHGGMGEVYEAARADVQFEQRAALKVIRHEAAPYLERFNAERQILARLDHPGIARLLDGGIATDGRPYAVMEYVEGESLLKHCDMTHADLHARLGLFMQVCDAVAYAHRNLVVHRDIKPNNVLVDREGRTRLLDFGIAKLLDAEVLHTNSGAETARLLTPDYAAPEQLTSQAVTTATDVYALGLLLFELLVGRRAWDSSEYSLVRIVASALDRTAPKASVTAQKAPAAPIPAHLLEGDLDAILSKCLRPEPEQRYATVNALLSDLERSRRGDPISARSGARVYVLGRMLRRYRWAVAGVVILIATLGVGVATTAWQAQRANREAARAVATRDFLLDVFRASDPRIARDRPPGEITAKELLDLSVDRIEKEFGNDPQTQLELLGLASEIYGHWLDEARFQDLLGKRASIAREKFGPTHPVVVESVTLNAWASIYTQDYREAQRLLAEADRLIRDGGHENSLLRAEWWLAQAQALKSGQPSARIHALDRAVEIYEQLDPKHSSYAIALANSATVYLVSEDFAMARSRNEAAIRVFSATANRNDGDLALTYANYARSLQHLGEFEAAERAYEQSKSLIRKVTGERHGSYWQLAADHARFVHMRGEHERAHEMFNALFTVIPEDWDTTIDDVVAREYYAERLAAEGRAQEAIPLLEVAERTYIERPLREYDLRRVRQTLGDAYAQVGRSDDARRMLAAARDERMQKDRADSIAVLSSRERSARFLLDLGQVEAARTELLEIMRIGKDAATYPLALAHTGLARIAIANGDRAAALAESRRALSTIDRVSGLYDLRVLPMIWTVHADALDLDGDVASAREYRSRALDATRRYYVPPR
jgi:serine/threonine-protein kinase